MKITRKITAILMSLALMVGPAAFAEENAPAEAAEQPQQQTIVSESTSVVSEETAVATVETAAEVPAPETTEETGGETTASETPAQEAPAGDVTDEVPAEGETPAEEEVPTEEEVPAEEETPVQEETPVSFSAKVKIEMENTGDIYYGDTITLKAVVSGANMDYSIRWEVNDGSGWKAISGAGAAEYSFVVTQANAGYAYRVVLTAEA